MATNRLSGAHDQHDDERWRVFAAVPVNGAVRSIMQRAQNTLKSRSWPVRWVDPRLAHITLRFYGDSDIDAVAGIRGNLGNIAGCHDAMLLRTGGIGAFPSATRARVLWLGLDGDVDSLRTLVTSINSAGAEDARGDKRSFKPHVTLARLRNGAQPPADVAETVAGINLPTTELTVDRIQLMRSVLGPKGPTYTIIDEWPLGAPTNDLSAPETPELHDHG